MQKLACVALILLASAGCDKDERQKEPAPSTETPAEAPASEADAGTADAAMADPDDAGAADAGAADAGAVLMPERPIPKPQTMVSASAPQETQMKAIGYMVAMRAPRPGDPPADDAYATALVDRLRPVVLAMDKGADKARFNRVERVASGRQIDMLMAEGCDAKAPFNAVVQRLNVPLSTLLSNGVLVLRCNDKKRQCLQSTRDPDDVLCTTAPRRK